jgi:hypothetical protein
LNDRGLAERLASIRTTYIPTGPGGATISTYGQFAAKAWVDFESADIELGAALDRTGDYEAVDALVGSDSTKAERYVLARYWVGERGGVKDLFTFSTGPVVIAHVYSGFTDALRGNQRWRHIKNIDPRIGEDYGFVCTPAGWWYPDHHFDPTAPSTTLDEGLRAAIAQSAREFLERVRPGGR